MSKNLRVGQTVWITQRYKDWFFANVPNVVWMFKVGEKAEVTKINDDGTVVIEADAIKAFSVKVEMLDV